MTSRLGTRILKSFFFGALTLEAVPCESADGIVLKVKVGEALVPGQHPAGQAGQPVVRQVQDPQLDQLLEGPLRQLRQLAHAHVEQVEMPAAAGQPDCEQLTAAARGILTQV